MVKPKNIIAQIDKNLKNKKWKCLASDCNETAINSHLIQQNGLLNNISNNGHLVELKRVDSYKWDKNTSPLSFKNVGITQALSFKVFCNHHDSKIFKPIENQNRKFETYEAFLLFSYRAVCAEIRKKEITIEKFTRIINSSTLSGYINKDILTQIKEGNILGVKDLKTLKNEFEEEIQINKETYKFYTFNYPKIDIYASAVFSSNNANMLGFEEVYYLDNIYIHILPLLNETKIIIGYNKKYASKHTIKYCESWEGLSYNDFQSKLTELFILNIENWGISNQLYSKIKQKNKTKYIQLLRDNLSQSGLSKTIDLNLFETT